MKCIPSPLLNKISYLIIMCWNQKEKKYKETKRRLKQ